MIVEIKKIKIRQFRYIGHLYVTFRFIHKNSKPHEKKVLFSMANFLIENRKNNLNTKKNICNIIQIARTQGSLKVKYYSCAEIEKKLIFNYTITNL